MVRFLIILISVILFTSCFYSPDGDSSPVSRGELNTLIITDIEYYGNDTKCWYGVKSKVQNTVITSHTIWFTDTIGKYDIGYNLNNK